MSDEFVLVRKRKYQQVGDRAKIYVTGETYRTLARWAEETDLTMIELCSMAVEYAKQHLKLRDASDAPQIIVEDTVSVTRRTEDLNRIISELCSATGVRLEDLEIATDGQL